MKELFLQNDIRKVYNWLKAFLNKNYHAEKITGKINKDNFEIVFRYNSLEPILTAEYINQGSFHGLKLCFCPFEKIGDFTSFSLSGCEINIHNLRILLKLCKIIKTPKCSKCGNYPVKYYEEGFRKTTYNADLTGNPYLYKYRKDNYSPLPIRVLAKCICGNHWTVKGIVSASQIKETINLNNYDWDYLDRSSTKRYTQKEIDELLTQPTEYAKIENEKKHFGRTKITKKEIKQLLDAIKAGNKDD